LSSIIYCFILQSHTVFEKVEGLSANDQVDLQGGPLFLILLDVEKPVSVSLQIQQLGLSLLIAILHPNL